MPDSAGLPYSLLHPLREVGKNKISGCPICFALGGETEVGDLLIDLDQHLQHLGPEGLGGDHQAGEAHRQKDQRHRRRPPHLGQGTDPPGGAPHPADQAVHPALKGGGGPGLGQLPVPGQGGEPQVPGHGRGLAEQPVQLLISHTSTPNPSRASRSRALARDTVRSTADTVMSSTRAISRLSSPRSYFSSSTVR